jgi:hypothetical protein
MEPIFWMVFNGERGIIKREHSEVIPLKMKDNSNNYVSSVAKLRDVSIITKADDFYIRRG